MNGRGLLGELALQFGIISVVAIGGGNAVLPEMHRMVVETHGWMTSETFANLYALAQAAPGPNIMIVTLIGWYVAGIPGALVSTAALTIVAMAVLKIPLVWIVVSLLPLSYGAAVVLRR